MGRVSQVISDRCSRALSDLAGRSGPLTLETLTFNATLKYSICQDRRIAVDILDESSFEVYEVAHGDAVYNSKVLPEARLSDFFLGASRVEQKYKTVLELLQSDNSAWLLVSAYYSAFFACIELTKMFGRISFSVDESDMNDLKLKATGTSFAEFFNKGHNNFVGVERAGKLRFNSIGTKPHYFAWDNASKVAKVIFQDRNWTDAINFMAMLENKDCAPSNIRNTWNYKRADYFGVNGERRAKEFRKIIGNTAGAQAWIEQRGANPGELDPCVVAVMAETLSTAVIVASQRAKEIVRTLASS